MNSKFLIAGPCAAESREQVLATAKALAQLSPLEEGTGEVIFRAGIWKPRTSPDTFQGVGAEGLAWLQEVKETYGLPVATEVATPEQVRLALEAGIDYLWIGARTSANPIAVQEIAASLNPSRRREASPHEGGLKGVFVKNPVNEDAALWMGNIQRLQSPFPPSPFPIKGQGEKPCGEGRPMVFAVFRGCNHRPCWRMAYTLRQAMPEVPLLLDPSHMSGDAARIPALVHQAEQLGLDGLMVEVHPDPTHALSDSRQQLTPEEFKNIILNSRTTSTSPALSAERVLGKGCPQGGEGALTWLRAIMDEVDDRLWDVYLERLAVSREIGELKQQLGMPALQPGRWNEVMERRLEWAKANGLDTDNIRTILDAIHRESLSQQAY